MMSSSNTHPVALSPEETHEIALRGVAACRRGRWRAGMADLAVAAQADEGRKDLPGVFYSYLGYGIARFENRRKDGIALCKHAIKVEFYRGENYANLAHTYMLIDNRVGAVRVIRKGLKVDPTNRALKALLAELGLRRKPVIGFLRRSHPVNVFLGKLRHRLTSR